MKVTLSGLSRFLSLILLLVLSVSHRTYSQNYLKIMPLGNSITFDQYTLDTRGNGDKISYRYKLYQDLTDAGYDFDFIGSERSGWNYLPTTPRDYSDNAGFPGINPPQLLTLLQTGLNYAVNPLGTCELPLCPQNYLTYYQPDVILLHIGTAGLTDKTIADNYANAITQILNAIDTYEAGAGKTVTVFLARIINRAPDGNHTWTTYYNTLLNNLVTGRGDANLKLVNMETGAGIDYRFWYDGGNMYDTLHPTETGYSKMAEVWFDALESVNLATPNVSGIPNQSKPEGSTFTVNLDNYVYDPQDPDAEMTWSSSSSGTNLSVSIDPTTHIATLTPVDENWNGSETITFRARDPLGAFDTDAAIFTLTAVNDVPVLSGIEGTSLGYTEDDGAVSITSTLAITDVDNTTMQSAVVAITSGYQNGQDVLSFSNANGITGTWNVTSGTMTLNGSSLLANYRTALRNVKYTNSSQNPSVITRTVSFTVNDGTDASAAVMRNITVSAVNDPPVLSGIETTPVPYTAGSGEVQLTATIQVADTDNASLSSATISITGNYNSAQDRIRFTNANNIFGSWNNGTGTMTLTGSSSLANYRTALRSVKYENINTTKPSTSVRTMTFRVNDGTANSNTVSRDVSFVPTATISGGGSICRYQKDTIELDLTGEPNWTVVIHRSGNSNPLLNKDTTITNIAVSPYSFQTNVTGTYTLVSVRDKNYDAGLVYGSAIIATYPAATAKLTGTAQICQDGSSAPLTVDFTGTSPWTFVLKRNTQDTTYSNIIQDPFVFNVTNQGIYKIISLNDQYCTGDTVAGFGTATLSYISSPKATISGTDTICPGDTATLGVMLEGTAPFSITYLVNGANAKTISNITQTDYVLKVKGEGIYTLSAVYDHVRSGCVSGIGAVVFYPMPTAAISGTGTICEHTSTNLRVTLTGTAPWTYSYHLNAEEPVTVPGVAVSPNFVSVKKAGTYSLVSVSDKFCNGTVSGNAIITVTPAPEVEITGLAPAYSKDTMMVPVFGNPDGGSFIPPLLEIHDTAFFFPYLFGPGMHTIIYAYRDPGTSCYGYDTVTVMVLSADAEITFPENDTKKLFCYYDTSFTIFGNNTVNDTGTFFISGGKGLVDNGDNTATISPTQLNGGTYTVTYRYFNTTYLQIQESFEVDYVSDIYIIGFDQSSYCQNSTSIRLNGNAAGGVFSGNAVYGNVGSGYYYRSDLTEPGPDTVFYTLTTTKGCTRQVFKSLTVFDTPEILFTVEDTCIYTGILDSTAFINLTTSGDIIQSWYWDFDDIESGIKNSSTLMNPRHRYSEGGRRNIFLRATTSRGCVGEDEIAFNFGDKPFASFSWETECFHAGQRIGFMNESLDGKGDITDYLWKFYTGDTFDIITTKDAEFLYDSPDDYDVELFVSTNYGCTDTILKVIHVRPTYSLEKGSSYYESFESGTAGWASSSSKDTKVNSWALGNPVDFQGAGGGVNAWYTNITENQPDAEQSYVTSPCFSFSGILKPMIKFDMRRLFNANRDGAILQYTTDNWNTSDNLGKYALNGNDGINWYNSFDIEGTPGGSMVGWSNIQDNSWINVRHNLDKLKGKEDVQFRLAYGSDGTAIGTHGLAFDNMWIGERNKMTLIEHFTNTSDQASLSADSQLDALANSNPWDIIDIQYHTSFPGTDPFNQLNQVDPRTRASFYQVSEVPVSILNGGTSSKFRYDYDEDPLDTTIAKIQSLMDPYFSLNLTTIKTNNTIDISVTVKPLRQLLDHTVTLHFAIIERMVSGVTGANGDTLFESVLKTMLPDTSFMNDWDPSSGEAYTVNRSWNFKNTYNADELRVIVFIQDEDEYTREIYQSAISEYDLHTALKRDNDLTISDESAGFIVFPNPASNNVYILFDEALEKRAKADLFDISGKLILTRELFPGDTLYEASTDNCPEGFYFMRITSDNRVIGSHKLIISR
jgi:hypothetical protein